MFKIAFLILSLLFYSAQLIRCVIQLIELLF